MNTTYRKNLKDVATACKNYTDTQIVQAKEEIYWHIGEYSVTTSDDNTSASVKTVPSNATRCKIKRVYGNTQKLNPTTASDSTSAMMKTMPSTVYDFDVSKVEGVSEKSENLIVLDDVAETTTNGITYKVENGIIYLNGTTSVAYWTLNLTLGTDITNGSYAFSPFNTTAISNSAIYLSATTSGTDNTLSVSQTSTITNSTTCKYLRVYIHNNGTTVNIIIKPMLVTGSTAPTEFKVGYTGIHNFVWNGVKVEGANLISEIKQNGSWRFNFIAHLKPNTNYFFSSDKTIQAPNCILWNKTKTIQIVQLWSSDYGKNTRGMLITTPSDILEDDYYVELGINTSSPDLQDTILNYGSTALPYVPYISPTTIPIDISTILYNGNPLFEENALKGVGTAKDYITPYKVCKVMGRVNLGSVDWTLQSGIFYAIISDKENVDNNKGLCSLYDILSTNATSLGEAISLLSDKQGCLSKSTSNPYIYVKDSAYTDTTTFKTAMSGVYLYYELATPIEVSINWASTLRGITGYSNGTITLLNTNNMDSANTITYNSIIKENCCAKMVQSRNGSVIKTINFPTQTSDGYSAGSVSNVRDFTINKRGTPVDKQNDLNTLNWSEFETAFIQSTDLVNVIKKPSSNSVVANVLSIRYNTVARNSADNTNDICVNSDGYVVVRNRNEIPNGVFYYENNKTDEQKTSDIDSIENIIEVQPNDTLSFYDSEDNLVTVPTDLTYRIEVAN